LPQPFFKNIKKPYPEMFLKWGCSIFSKNAFPTQGGIAFLPPYFPQLTAFKTQTKQPA